MNFQLMKLKNNKSSQIILLILILFTASCSNSNTTDLPEQKESIVTELERNGNSTSYFIDTTNMIIEIVKVEEDSIQ